MRRSINQIARGFGWAVAVAGTLGLTLPTAAQVPFFKGFRTPTGPATKAAPQVPSEGQPSRIDDATVRLVHTRAQMAWLADPVTFAYNLGVHSTPQGLEVTGFVPNDIVRQRAMQLAQKHSALPLANGLKIHPGMAMRFVHQVSRTELQREAEAALKEVFGERAKRWRVVAEADGRVTLGGSCRSLEEQVQISKCLRRVGQCACVSNHLTLGAAPIEVAVAQRFPTPVITPLVAEPVAVRSEKKVTITSPVAEPVVMHAEKTVVVSPPAAEPVMVHAEKTVTVSPPQIAPMPQEPPALPPTVLAQQDIKVESPPTPPATIEVSEPQPLRVEPPLVAETKKTAEKVAEPTVAAAKQPVAGEVYETVGEIQFESSPADGKGAAGASGPLSADTLRQAILARCGASVREVRVEILRDQRLHITLRLAPNTDRGAVEQQIRQIPDVANYPHPIFWD
jgi:hypothetical protein